MKYLTLILALIAAPAWAKLPADFTGTVVKVSDGDTYIVKRSDGSEVKVRLHSVDAPEVAHRKGEVDQPGGTEAQAFISDYYLNEKVSVHPCGLSYGRIVGDVTAIKNQSLAADLVESGNAMVDPRYKPSKQLLELQAAAKEKHRGIWKDNPTPPWEWRKMTRDQQLKVKGK